MVNIQSLIPVVAPSMYKYRSLPKECLWGEYLTRLPKGISPHLTTKEHSCHVYSDSTPSKQIFGQIIKCNGTISHFEAKSWWHTTLSEQHHVTLWCPPRLTMSVFAKKSCSSLWWSITQNFLPQIYIALRYCASTLHKARSRLGAHSSKLWTYTGNWAGSGCFFARCVTLPARTWWRVVLCPALALSGGKGSGDYWVLPWLCQISNFDIWTKEWLYFYDVALFHWLVPTLVWRCTISLACSESILLTRYNQESSQWSPDAFPHERVGSGHNSE